ncbi:MAG: lysine--tRNA ligase, partial [Ilumatobacteraceae bacterium]
MTEKPASQEQAVDQKSEAERASGFAIERSRRLNAVNELRGTGSNPYPYRFDRTHTLGELRETFASLEAGSETETVAAVAGRIMLKRDQGKLIFITIKDRSAEIQLFVSKATVGDSQFDAINNLDLGDWVGAHGAVMTTRKGELSIKVTAVELLSKALRPLPDKFHGLTDIDTRYRQRYADLIVNDEARRVFEVRHATIASFRRTLRERDYIEVETPVLHIEAGGAHARPFLTHHNTLDMPLFLRIALELHLKRLIVGGMERVFEIGRVFRNEGISTRHNPEFTMMESYQAFADHTDVMDLTEVLIRNAANDALGTTFVNIRGTECDLAKPWRRVRMIDLASEAVGEKVHPSQSV